MTGWTITGGQVLRDAALAAGTLALRNGVVAEAAAPDARRFDASGLLVLPGIVDIHGDAHERQFQPRPGVAIPAPQALRDSAAQILAAGITTAFLGVTLSWEPGLRSLDAWKTLLAELEKARPTLAADLRVHLRFEVDNLAALETALADIEAGRVDLLAFNDHTPSIARKLVKEAAASKYAERAGVGVAEIRAMAESVLAGRHAMPAARERLAAAARARGISMLSHDDATLEDRALHRALGAAICEFPMAEAVGRDARAAGEDVVMGAPNVVRGGSHLGWASAAPLAEQGIVTILASDYVWPCLMQAAFILEGRGVLDLAQAWALISANPARAAGLTDRGRLETGLRGDVVVVDAASRSTVAVFCAGALAWVAPTAAGRF
ncbi:alpha-D-ribose 1-methylphosphonate 5-triphosphate diphosphatase [Roseomonas sp. USHLN139]|uniref:alpha-D-ribose 1-methylphosphonate 5-triphosphate diphosphatase n=1 Tax=Roseomonas sp. USHLN139 TaxID=3081298 RepID=UPI003B01BFC0